MPASDITRLQYRSYLTLLDLIRPQSTQCFILPGAYTQYYATSKKDDVIEISPRGDLPHHVVQEAEVERDD